MGIHLRRLACAARGKVNEGDRLLLGALPSGLERKEEGGRTDVYAYRAQLKLWCTSFSAAASLAGRALALAQIGRNERDLFRVVRLQGTAALGTNRLQAAQEKLHSALTGARAVHLIEEELPALIGLAELRRREGGFRGARELLDDVWELAERGSYQLFLADALNVLAHIERDVGNRKAGTEAATKAYCTAWCNGRPYVYHWVLEAAKRHLSDLGVAQPGNLLAFDQSKYEPDRKLEVRPGGPHAAIKSQKLRWRA